jgi:ADP-ribose pyrophosphatase YjhB (NUDIX family)
MGSRPLETTSAGGVVVNKRGEILVVNQKGVSWSLPKGHIESGEDALTAARREIAEESGISQLEYVKDLGNYSRYRISKDGRSSDETEIKTIHLFLFKTNQENLKPIDPENPEALWVAKDKVADLLTHPKDKEFFLKIVDGIDF